MASSTVNSHYLKSSDFPVKMAGSLYLAFARLLRLLELPFDPVPHNVSATVAKTSATVLTMRRKIIFCLCYQCNSSVNRVKTTLRVQQVYRMYYEIRQLATVGSRECKYELVTCRLCKYKQRYQYSTSTREHQKLKTHGNVRLHSL